MECAIHTWCTVHPDCFCHTRHFLRRRGTWVRKGFSPKQSGWTVHHVWMAHSMTHFGNQRTPSLIFASVSPTKVSRQLRKRKCAFSILDTPCTSEFIAMTQNRLESSQRNSGAT